MAKDSVYSTCSEYIEIAEADDRLAIKTDWLAEKVHENADLSDMTREDLELKYIKSIVAICLYQHGYRSVVVGQGYYVKPDLDTNPVYVEKLVENAADAEIAKRIMKYGLENVLRDIRANMEGQMWFDEESKLHTNPTVEEILEMLAKDA